MRHEFRRGAGAIRPEVRPVSAAVECCIGDPDRYATREGGFAIEAPAAGLVGTIEMQSGPVGTMTVVSFPHL